MAVDTEARRNLSYYRTREVRRYYLRCPEFPDGHRERTTRKRAAEDFIEALGRYLSRPGARPDVHWAMWAAAIIPGNMPTRPAPDGTAWGIVTKVSYP